MVENFSIYPSGQRLEIIHSNLLTQKVDAIVNAANAYLQHGGGIAGLIVSQGGQKIQEESDAWVKNHGPVSHSEPAYTSAGSLPCQYIIHAVGPIWGDGDEEHKLAQAITGSLRRAESLGLSSIAFPAISTGIFRFPKELAARIFFATLQDFFKSNPKSAVTLVQIVLYDQATLDIFLHIYSIWKDQQAILPTP
jgi:O-acetyl-ADP-ribose deacetylase